MKFEWTEKCQHSLKQLKLKLTIAPILKISNANQVFVVCTDACAEALGGVLLQENSFIEYESRKLKKHEHNYIVYDLELAAVIHMIEYVETLFVRKEVHTNEKSHKFEILLHST